MSGFDFSQVPQDKLVEIGARSFNTVDALWFLEVEERYGFDVAYEIDVRVWQRFSPIHARRLLEHLNIRESTPVRTVARLIQADPLSSLQKPEFVSLTDSEARFRCTDCPTQTARIRDGKELFPGEPVCRVMYQGYASAVDPRVKVTCLTCPPRTLTRGGYPSEYWCQWQVEMTTDGGG